MNDIKGEPGLRLRMHRVHVVERGRRARRGYVRCEIDRHLIFDTERLETYCLASWDEKVYDAFVLAAAVQFCDHTKKRPSASWGRHIVLQVPVHDPDLWNAKSVSEALHDALQFLTGDRWDIAFTRIREPVKPLRQGNLRMPGGPCAVIPYSEGLDSRAVAGLAALDQSREVIRVRLGSKRLNGCGDKRQPFAAVPYSVGLDNKARSVESSGRSRGFKFALLSGIAAVLSGADKVIVPESGQGALGPVLVPAGQAYEDYRNHPLFTDRMEKFIYALFGHTVCYSFPRLWYRKGETLARFATECPDGAHWRQTRSCWQGSRQVSVSGKMRQCGICAACLLRRMSVHAMGMTEPAESYVWGDLSAERFEDGKAPGFKLKKLDGAQYQYAIAGTLHLDHLAGLLQTRGSDVALDRQVCQLGQSLGLPEEEVRSKLTRLLNKHEEEWRSFLNTLGPKSFVARWARGGQ
ncbi:MAG: ATPase [Gammaproteobacteria bacterium]|nr:ATPase [Gammaproteobacteria bacterium]